MNDEHGMIIRHVECAHDWVLTGMFLMKMASYYDGSGYPLGLRLVGGLDGHVPHQTPEVEMCRKCGLLRIPLAEQPPAR